MHKLIAERMGLIGRVDYKDRDKRNNQRDNIRLANRSENQWNQGVRKSSKSGLKGVRYCKRRWYAEITLNNKYHFLGSFNNPEDAARAYDRVACIYHRAFASCNFEQGRQQDAGGEINA